MPQVDFYILHHTQARYARNRFVCQLTDKAWHQGHRIYIHTVPPNLAKELDEAKELDDLLWTFKADSFLPHDLHPNPASSTAPIRIGYTDQVCENMTVLINLTETVPAFVNQFQRIVEIVMDTPSARETGRQRYRGYREMQYELITHDISKS